MQHPSADVHKMCIEQREYRAKNCFVHSLYLYCFNITWKIDLVSYAAFSDPLGSKVFLCGKIGLKIKNVLPNPNPSHDGSSSDCGV